MAAQDSDNFFDSQSDEGSTPPVTAADISSLAAAPTQPAARSPRPAKAPPNMPVAKAPPAALLLMHQNSFRNIAEEMEPTPTPPWPTNALPPPDTGNAAPGPVMQPPLPLETRSVTSSHSHNQSEQHATASQGTAGEANTLRPATNQQADPGPWAVITDAAAGHNNAQRPCRHTRDIRIRGEVTLHWLNTPFPREQRWASHRFEEPMYNEWEFIKAWFMALKDHDHGIMHILTQYCNNRSDGTLDLFKHTCKFIRNFLFIYGSQDGNFFTQNSDAELLSVEHERWLLAESAAAYHATHVDYATPHTSPNWPPASYPGHARCSTSSTAQHNPGIRTRPSSTQRTTAPAAYYTGGGAPALRSTAPSTVATLQCHNAPSLAGHTALVARSPGRRMGMEPTARLGGNLALARRLSRTSPSAATLRKNWQAVSPRLAK